MSSLPFTSFLRRFRADENGSITVETLLMVPLLVWCYMAVFVFFDAFRTQSLNVKATYTIADMVARESDFITPAYLNATFALQEQLLQTGEPRSLQITAYTFNSTRNRYEVRWSRAVGGLPQLTTATIAPLAERLPSLPDGVVSILIQSRVNYRPFFDVGIEPFVFTEFSSMRARWSPQICWNNNANGNLATQVC